jgi:tRNA A37 threonylcarbamoyltransferase TsaD
MALCSDNGAMIALMGFLQLQRGLTADMALEPTATPQSGGKAKSR